MARILLALVVLLLLLNGMTFLLVVNQGGGTEKAQAAAPPATRTAPGPDAHTLKLDQVSQSLQGLQKSVTDLTRRVDDFGRKLAAQNARTIPAPAALPPAAENGSLAPATAGAGPGKGRIGAGRTIPAVRTGPTEISSPGRARPAPPPPPEPEVEDDNAADHAPAATPSRLETSNGEPAPDASQGGEGSPQPAEEGGTGTPVETPETSEEE